MLNIRAIPNTSAAKNYFKARNADYYIDGQDYEAYWHGRGAERLGLSGAVAEEAYKQLCDNINPATGDQLTAKTISNRRVGYDFTFSLPKSVSLVAAIGGDDRIEREFRAAVADTMAEVEREMATRVRQRGADADRTTGNMIWADFLHHTARPVDGHPDPQYHIHVVAFNATYDHEEGQWKAGQFGGLKKDAGYFEAVFRSRMVGRLQALGYDVRRTKDAFEVVGISRETIDKFSRRTAGIDKKAEELETAKAKWLEHQKKKLNGAPMPAWMWEFDTTLNPEAKAGLAARTREAKDTHHTWDDLQRLWQGRLESGELEAITGTVHEARQGPLAVEHDHAAALDVAVRHAFERSSVVPQRELVTHALKFGLGTSTPEGILEEVGKRPDLIRRKVKGVEMVSTQGVLSEERNLLAFAEKGKGRWRPLSPGGQSRKLDQLATLSLSQSSAVCHAWQSRDRLILIRGAAGTGKTRLTKELLAGVNVPWVILAPSAEASRGVLRREGFEGAETLAKFLQDTGMQEQVRGGLIVLDEASLAGAHDVAKLVESADRLNARILLLGDRRQHKSVARGDVLALLEDKAGLPVAEVSEIRRQSGEYRSAVKLAAQGDVAAAVGKLDALGWVKEGDGLVDEYLDAVKAGKSVLVVSPTHAEGEKVTAAIRAELRTRGRGVRQDDGTFKEKGILHGDEKTYTRLEAVNLTQAERCDPETLRAHAGETAQFVRQGKAARAGARVTITAENAAELAKEGARFTVYRPRELPLAAGDTIRITANGKALDGKHRLNNGAVYQVAGFTSAGNIRLSNGWVIGQDFGHLTHGYVTTSHASQGRTVERVLIHAPAATFGAVDKATGYVAMSRGRERATIYTDDREALLEAVDRDRPRMLATELVREPRHRVRERLKKHLAWLRGVVARSRDHGHELTAHREAEVTIERR